MQIKYIPQFNPRDFLVYTFEDKKIIVNYNGTEEEFDFSSVDLSTDGFVPITVDKLDINPFRSQYENDHGVWIENGETNVKLIEYYQDSQKYSGEEGIIKTEWEVV